MLPCMCRDTAPTSLLYKARTCRLQVLKQSGVCLQRYTLELKPGDSVVVATDGLLDNIFLGEHNSQQTEGDTPFAVGARAAGKAWAGGKIDDIAILVVHVF